MASPVNGAAVLEISGVTVSFGRGRKAMTALAPVELSVAAGESLAVTGRSGAGKSTLADTVLGLRTPTAGAITVAGQPWCSPAAGPRRGQRHLVQGVPQDPIAAFVPRWTLRTSIEQAVRRLSGTDNVAAAIADAARLAELDPALLDRRPSQVSGGQAQRAAITRALACRPAVLVADEPTSALDPDTSLAVSSALLSLVGESGIALLLVTHDPAFAERCSRAVRIDPPMERTTH